ncbi:WD repeat-containing protein 90 isoform X2 [Erpetoichthys calabaricus]|uniref:WD repeat-containing protein 90 isoform X2 n=1 Tax=Erpetoichthys calabaricus TaxID=27687 RepID=UPI002234BBD1|nr:WD repeat-containing protein 90 isoform X2 [Erpetoichthys calabaricus]
MSNVWQHPYVNIFKHFKVEEWKKATKEGDVTTIMDKTLKCTVYRIRGAIPASNYILLPKTSTQSLGLTGRYLYLLFKPTPEKHFVVHLDVATKDCQVIRISFSNLFKEFKSTATWLQFPFVCGAAKDSVYDHTSKTAKQDLVGPAPSGVRWTCLMMDLRYTLSIYLNRHYSHLKSIKFCSSLLVKNAFTSDLVCDPGLTFADAKQTGLTLQGFGPMPREMCFPVHSGENWHDLYDYIRFPSDGSKMPFDSIQKGQANPVTAHLPNVNLRRQQTRTVNISKPIKDRVSLIQQIVSPKMLPRHCPPLLTTSLPELCLTNGVSQGMLLTDTKREDELQNEEGAASEISSPGIEIISGGDHSVHVFAQKDNDITIHRHDSEAEETMATKITGPVSLSAKKVHELTKLLPDPILKLNRIIGFGGSTTKSALWTKTGVSVVYPCHAVITSMDVATGRQRFFFGHTDKVSALSFNGNSTLLASAQTGNHSMVRIWSYPKGACLTMFKTHAHSVCCLSFSYNGGVLCGVGKDNHGKNMVVLWNTSKVNKGGEVVMIAKAHTDVDIQTMKIAFFDDTRMISCGRGNIRLWRVRSGALRSCPVNLGEYHSQEFTDVAFEEGHCADREPEDRTVYACSKSGHILEIDYKTVIIRNVRRLLPSQPKHSQRREKQTFNTGSGIAINSISISSTFCATGSEDGFLRLWPLDFSSVFLEAEHEGPVNFVSIGSEGLSILAATSTGNLGYLDVSSRKYTTLMRSHVDTILAFSIDGIRRHIATVSLDNTIRVWDLDSMQQLYDFISEDIPSTVSFHPMQPVFACGFSSGMVRVFSIARSTILAEHKQHRGQITGLRFSPNGEYLYSAGSMGALALYSAAEQEYHVIRVLGNVVVRRQGWCPDVLTVSDDSRSLAFVGPTEYIVTVMDACSLDELLRIDVSILDLESTNLDSAVKVCYAPTSVGHLLVSTSSNKILWLDAKSGRLIREVSNVHKQQCSSLSVSDDGQFLITAGEKVVKVWDYNMKHDVNYQVFIGHSEQIQQVNFAPDQLGIVTVGDAVYIWDFLASPAELQHSKRVLSPAKPQSPLKQDENSETNWNQKRMSSGMPRQTVPVPISGPSCLDISAISRAGQEDLASLYEERVGSPQRCSTAGPLQDSFLRITLPPSSLRKSLPFKSSLECHNGLETEDLSEEEKKLTQNTLACPDAYKHFTPRFKTSSLAQNIITPPTGEEYLKLKAVIGYNGNGRGNMFWNPDTGLFIYTCGCVVVVENLHTGLQKHWLGHYEEISTLAVTHDAQVVASASKNSDGSCSLICIWNIMDGSTRTTISFHKGEVQAMTYSRDDRYLLSAGDYRDLSIALWATSTYQLLATVSLSVPIHDLSFNPVSDSKFACTGSGFSFFCLIKQQGKDVELKMHKVPVPEEMGKVEQTALCYSCNSILYTSTNNGKICAWDLDTNRCFMTWDGDEGEIGVLLCRGNRLLTGSNSRRIRLWSVAAVHAMRGQSPETSHRNTSVLLEQEMSLDSTVVCAAFDDVLDMGIVGTTAGTLWYINWIENTSIRLISGHKNKVNDVAFSQDETYFATCADDGSVRVWSAATIELVVQFQVLNQSCLCISWRPAVHPQTHRDSKHIAAGYSDGTLRFFSIRTMEMEMKLHPHQDEITAIQFSVDGQVVLSGGKNGLMAVNSHQTGMTIRLITDHRGAAVTSIQCARKGYNEFGLEGSEVWLASSSDRRVSIWVADWQKGKCELLDWLSFPAPSTEKESDWLPPSLAVFSPSEPGVLLYVGYGMEKEITFYSLHEKQIIKSIALTHWSTCLSICPKGNLVSVGCQERLLKLINPTNGRFQDFICHSDSLHICRFSPSGKQLFTSAYNEILLWDAQGL